ncbi:MAG: tRNA uridine-5-carboxymethylaminomethyl(34) synthesis GTPase MnmE [Buchnera aphidicola (Periphyllus aceris)]|nr:tRNA uridine-5-carboxymethylaminomethyl(34) synthesis GTPase MnmE [Buchnera aphidicola (Periphyllus aceris)]
MSDTIIAQATPQGIGGVYIVRISGKKTSIVLKNVLKKIIKPRYAVYSKFFDLNGDIIDQGIAIWFPSPNSFTGEDVLELQGHGNNFIVHLLIKNILKIKGLRIAEPGEFSKRSFLNNKIDLIQSESISDLIHSTSEASVKASLNSLNGDFSFCINKIINKVKNLRSIVEVELNFVDENIDLEVKFNILNIIKKLIISLKKIIFISKNSEVLKNGIKIVIAGFPNSGKSSLFNFLSCKNSSIVTNIKGTTRDLIHSQIILNHQLIELTDTAGLRKTNDKIENIGINLAKNEINCSNILLFLIDLSKNKKNQLKKFDNYLKNISSNIYILLVFNKIDKIFKSDPKIFYYKNVKSISISIKKKIGLENLYFFLKKYIDKIINIPRENIFLIRQRHIKEIKLSLKELYFSKSEWKINKNYEILADSLKNVQNFLNKITGKVSSEEILNEIFSNFCIGK